MNAIICPVGGLLVSVVLDRIGRKNTFYAINVIACCSWIIVATASRTDRSSMYAQLLCGRVLIGLSGGLASSPCGIYTAEVAHSSLRGRMSILSSLGISIGIFFVYIMGYFIPVNIYLEICFQFKNLHFNGENSRRTIGDLLLAFVLFGLY